MRLLGLAGVILLFTLGWALPAMAADEFPPLFPFVVNQGDLSPDNVTNFSFLNEKPAGKAGFVTIKDGSFYTADDKRIRFMGVNICWSAGFPSHEQAEQIAAQLARFGINLVRFHNLDRYESPEGFFLPGVYPRQLDPKQMDRLDYFVAQLKEHGIYSIFNLKGGRTLQPAEGFPLLDGRPGYDRGITLFHPQVIALHKEHTKSLLTHYNPYTGNHYTDEPALLQVEINNEDGLFYTWQRQELDKTPQVLLQPLAEMWTNWLREKYGTTEDLRNAWSGLGATIIGLPEGESLETGVKLLQWADAPKRMPTVQRDYIQFLWDTELAYYKDMYHFIKEELGAKNFVVGSQVTLSPPSIQAELDIIDAHNYFSHPQYTTPGPGNNYTSWYVNNVSMVNNEAGGPLSQSARLRVAGKPFMLSEYNHPAPNSYSAEAFLLAGAYAAFQDWDGFTVFDWSSNQDFWAPRLTNHFNIKGHTVKQVTLPAAAAMLIRGDVQPGPTVLQVPLTMATQQSLLGERSTTTTSYNSWSRPIPTTLPLQQRVERTLDDSTTSLQIRSTSTKRWVTETNEVVWDLTLTGRGVVTVDTARSKAVIGYGANRTFALGDVTIKPGNTRLDGWSTITLTLHDGESFTTPARALLVATAYNENLGTFLETIVDNRTTIRGSWGSGPVMVEGVSAVIDLAVPADRVTVYALDNNGYRTVEVPVTANTAGNAGFSIGAEYKTLWYEVVIK
ncbi:MAG: hypothetical protein ACOX44_15325 [Limnochordia bacterium]|jgi:hypothetical protein